MRPLALALFFILILWSNAAAGQQKKLVFIILDGIPAKDLERVPSPNLDQIAQQGGYARAYTGGIAGGYTESPTISAVGYNTLLTGTWANKHQVWGNGIEAPNYHYWTIFRYPHDAQSDYIHQIDQQVAQEAADYLRASGPDLTWVYLQYTDDMGHKFGRSSQLDAAIQKADAQVGLIWKAIQQRQQKGEDWQLWITTDHGRKEPDAKGHGGQSESEREIWISTNAQDLNARFHSGQAAIVDVLPSMIRFFNLVVPEHQERELDGVPLTGPLSLSNLTLVGKGKNQELSWAPGDQQETLSVYWSPTDHFGEGGSEEYFFLGEVPSEAKQYSLPTDLAKRSFFKVLVVGKYNSANTWRVSGKHQLKK